MLQNRLLIIGCCIAVLGVGCQGSRGKSEYKSSSEIKAHIFFGNIASYSLEDLRLRALEELANQGLVIGEIFSCGINVIINNDNSECLVVFANQFDKPFYRVRFNAVGEVVEVETGAVSEIHNELGGMTEEEMKWLDENAVKVDP